MKLISLLLLTAAPVFAATITDADLQSACETYLSAKAPGEFKSWSRKFTSSVSERASSDGCSEESAASDMVKTWFADHQKEVLALKDGAVKLACKYFVYFREHGYAVPESIQENLKESDRYDLVQFLKEESLTK